MEGRARPGPTDAGRRAGNPQPEKALQLVIVGVILHLLEQGFASIFWRSFVVDNVLDRVGYVRDD